MPCLMFFDSQTLKIPMVLIPGKRLHFQSLLVSTSQILLPSKKSFDAKNECRKSGRKYLCFNLNAVQLKESL
jgi:hypothetical protein